MSNARMVLIHSLDGFDSCLSCLLMVVVVSYLQLLVNLDNLFYANRACYHCDKLFLNVLWCLELSSPKNSINSRCPSALIRSISAGSNSTTSSTCSTTPISMDATLSSEQHLGLCDCFLQLSCAGGQRHWTATER